MRCRIKSDEFWESHPALLPAISLLLGIGALLFHLNVWIVLLFSAYIIWQRKWASLILVVFGGLYACWSHTPLATPLDCTARFSIASLQEHQTPFHKNLVYTGTLYLDDAALPCKIMHPRSSARPPADQEYYVTGTLLTQDSFGYLFKPKTWTPIDKTWGWAELRFRVKSQIRTFLQTQLLRPRTAVFLSSLATGDASDRHLIYEFGRLGLQHLLAISGFHFGILMACISYLFRFFLPAPWKWGVLLILMTTYYLFIGTAPAVQRSWIAAVLFLIAKITHRRAIPLNILAAAMLIELLYNPLAVANLGFQFSFGSCFGILLLYQPIEEQFARLLPKRRAKDALSLSLPAQMAYLISSSLRRSLSLTLAVNIAILPILFFHFGKFPLLSLLYNLFFPPLVALTLVGLIAATALYFLSGSSLLFHGVDWLCAQLLDLAAHPPLFLDRAIYCKGIPYAAIPLYFAAVLAFVLYRKNRALRQTAIR
jgi:competence protein ComEC